MTLIRRANSEQRQYLRNSIDLLKLFRELEDKHHIHIVHANRYRVELQIEGSNREVVAVYEQLSSYGSELNIQKIEITEPGLRSVLDVWLKREVNLGHLGDQHPLYRQFRKRWEICRVALEAQRKTGLIEKLLNQIRGLNYLMWTYHAQSNAFAATIISMAFIVMLDCLILPVNLDRPLVQMHSFHKELSGVFCNNLSFSRSIYRRRILEVFADLHSVPAVSTTQDTFGQICVNVDAEQRYTIHAPVSAAHDIVVFAGRLYNAFLKPSERIKWFYHDKYHHKIVRYLSDSVFRNLWSWDLPYLVLASVLVTSDMFFIGQMHFLRANRTGFRMPAIWFATLAFIIAINLVFTLCRVRLSHVLSVHCTDAFVTQFICPNYPSLTPVCCEEACAVPFRSCRGWDIEAFSSRIGIGRRQSLLLYGILQGFFMLAVHLQDAWFHRKNFMKPRYDPIQMERMRLQIRNCVKDPFSLAEKEAAANINTRSFGGLLVRNLCIYEQNNFQLKDVNLIIKPGEAVILFGRSGSGRKTLLSAIAGRLDFDPSSEIYIGRHRVPLANDECRLVGYADTIDHLPQFLTVRDYLDMCATMRDHHGPWKHQHLLLILRLFALTNIAKLCIELLSLSKKKVVLIASAFVGNPLLAMLDDPLSDLEPADRRQVCTAINSLKTKEIAILISSLSLTGYETLDVDRAGVIAGGELITIRSLPDLLAIDTGYYIIVRLRRGAPVGRNGIEYQKNIIQSLLTSKFGEAKLMFQAGSKCEFHVRGRNVTCQTINEIKETLIETLTQAEEIKVGHCSGSRGVMHLADAVMKEARRGRSDSALSILGSRRRPKRGASIVPVFGSRRVRDAVALSIFGSRRARTKGRLVPDVQQFFMKEAR